MKFTELLDQRDSLKKAINTCLMKGGAKWPLHKRLRVELKEVDDQINKIAARTDE